MPKRSLHTAVVAAVVLLVASDVAAQNLRRIGIVTTTRVNASVDQTNLLSEALGDALRSELPLDVITGAEAQRRLPPEGLPEQCISSAECRSDIAKRLDADELLLLVVVRLGERMQIDITWANPASGEVASRDAISIESGQDAKSVFAGEARKLLPHIREPREDKPDIIVVTQPPQPGTRRDEGRRFTAATWVATGLAGGAAIGATVFTLSSRQKYDELSDRGCKTARLCSSDEIDSLRTHTVVADVLWGTALAAGVTVVVLYATSGSDADNEKPAVGVVAGGDSIGVSYGGRF